MVTIGIEVYPSPPGILSAPLLTIPGYGAEAGPAPPPRLAPGGLPPPPLATPLGEGREIFSNPALCNVISYHLSLAPSFPAADFFISDIARHQRMVGTAQYRK